MYLNSNKVIMFPSSKRGTVNKLNFDPNSRYASEFNLTNIINSLTDKKSFVISNELEKKYDDNNNQIGALLSFNIHGYYFQVDLFDTLSQMSGCKYIYACVAVNDSDAFNDVVNNNSPSMLNWAEPDSVHLDTALDNSSSNIDDYTFKGLLILDEPSVLHYSLKILEKKDNEWIVPEESKFRFSSRLIQSEDNSKQSLQDIFTSLEVYRSKSSAAADKLKESIGLYFRTPTNFSDSDTYHLNSGTFQDITLPAYSAEEIYIIPKSEFQDAKNLTLQQYLENLEYNINNNIYTAISNMQEQLNNIKNTALFASTDFSSTDNSLLPVKKDTKGRLYVPGETLLSCFVETPELSSTNCEFDIQSLNRSITVNNNKSSYISKVIVSVDSSEDSFIKVNSSSSTTTSSSCSLNVSITPKIENTGITYKYATTVNIAYYQNTSDITPKDVQQLPLTLIYKADTSDYNFTLAAKDTKTNTALNNSNPFILDKGLQSKQLTINIPAIDASIFKTSSTYIKHVYLSGTNLMELDTPGCTITKNSSTSFNISLTRNNDLLSNCRSSKSYTLIVHVACDTITTGTEVVKTISIPVTSEPMYDLTDGYIVSSGWYTTSYCTKIDDQMSGDILTLEAGTSHTTYHKLSINVLSRENYMPALDTYSFFRVHDENDEFIKTSVSCKKASYQSETSAILDFVYEIKFECNSSDTAERGDNLEFYLVIDNLDGAGDSNLSSARYLTGTHVVVPASESSGGSSFD